MSNAANVNELFKAAKEEGNIGPAAMNAIKVVDIGADIQAAMGTPADAVNASSAILVQVLVDDSGSIRMAGNSQMVRDGVNLIKQSLQATKQKDGILMGIRYLNGEILCPFVPLDQVPNLDEHNFNPQGGTPLYDKSMDTLATVVAKTQEFSDSGVPVRTITVIISDGADEHSAKSEAADVAAVVHDMVMTENHIVAAMGIDDHRTDFRQVFADMGVLENWILTPQNDPHSIRQAFQTVSQSAVRASQAGPQHFSQTAMGGFGNP